MPAILGVSAWVGSFVLFWHISPCSAQIARDYATFFSAGTLILLSMGFIAGLLCLKLPRTFWLACGAVGVVLIVLLAKPNAQRTDEISRQADLAGQLIFLTSSATQMPLYLAEPIIKVRNSVFQKNAAFLEQEIPESPWQILGLGLAQLLFAAGIGLWIGLGIDKAGHLIPLALVASLADVWSVSGGATAVIIKSSQIHYFLLRFPLCSGPAVEFPFLIGLTDFLFFAIFFQAAVRFKLGTVRNLLLLIVSFFAAVISAIFFDTGLPVLPFMGSLFLLVNFRGLSLSREETKQLLLFLLVAGMVALGATYLINR